MSLSLSDQAANVAATSPGPAEFSVVVPTFKERGNVAELVRRLDASLAGTAWEAIFVDDNSPDGTAAAVKEIAGRDPRVRCLRRVGRRGLAGACIEGMLSSAAPFVAVIDADLQHDEKVLPLMLAKLRSGEADLVAATRYVAGGSAASFSRSRRACRPPGSRSCWTSRPPRDRSSKLPNNPTASASASTAKASSTSRSGWSFWACCWPK
jgi:dolichol-phosphate mannosyltransferase